MQLNDRTRSRGWCFTWNNYRVADIEYLAGIGSQYYCFGKEVAPETGTTHLQGYIHWTEAKSFRRVKTLLPSCHLERRRGTATEAIDYCKKEGDFYECGDRPLESADGGRVERDRWNHTWTLATTGHTEDIDKDILIRNWGSLERIGIRYMAQAPCLHGVCGIWVWGKSGSGKTRAVLNAFPECFIKPRSAWWDGYRDESVVLVDDIDKYDKPLGGKLKHWADFAPFIAESKGGSRRIRPEKCIITSQYLLSEIWDDEETLEALGRRFRLIEKKEGEDISFE